MIATLGDIETAFQPPTVFKSCSDTGMGCLKVRQPMRILSGAKDSKGGIKQCVSS